MPNENGTARLDRIERALELLIVDHEQFRDEHKRLLTAQVALTDRIDKLAKSVQDLADARKHTDQRLNALMGVVDGWIRQRPPQ